MNEVTIAIIGGIFAIITNLITYFGTRANNKNKLEILKKDSEVKIRELENKLDLKEKDIEALRVQHELDLKTKEAELMSPFISKYMDEFIRDPEGTGKKLKIASQQADGLKAFKNLKKKN